MALILFPTHLLVGHEVDDGVVHGAGFGEVHGHGSHQRRDVQLRVHHHHYRDGSVGQPADEERSNHGQNHLNSSSVLLHTGFTSLKLHTFIQLWRKRKIGHLEASL